MAPVFVYLWVVQRNPPENHHQTRSKIAMLFSGRSMPYIKHVLLLGGVVLFLVTLVHFNSGYDHIFNRFGRDIGSNARYDSLNYDQRLEVKLGFTAKYLHMLRDSTPADAVILMPPDSILFPDDTTSRFNPLVGNRRWVAYFIYPRKIVYEDEKDSLALYKDVTHVAVVNYWGYQQAAPVRGERKRYTVLTR